MRVEGIWLPIITPFKDDEVDFAAYQKMIDYYIGKGIAGLISLGTTGESPTVADEEFEAVIDKTMTFVNGRVPVFAGVGGNDTRKVVKQLKAAEKYKIHGILSVCPYYNRPDQRGIYAHFSHIAQATDLDIIIYNIPYRTGRNIENETIHRLAELKNIVALKDSSGDIKQTMALLLDPPREFSIMTGEDALFYTTMVLGGQGGILASAHLQTDKFVAVYEKLRSNNHQAALAEWKKLAPFIPLLFEEPNPAPVKYCLRKLGLLDSDEVRLPLSPISEKLKNKLDKLL